MLFGLQISRHPLFGVWQQPCWHYMEGDRDSPKKLLSFIVGGSERSVLYVNIFNKNIKQYDDVDRYHWIQVDAQDSCLSRLAEEYFPTCVFNIITKRDGSLELWQKQQNVIKMFQTNEDILLWGLHMDSPRLLIWFKSKTFTSLSPTSDFFTVSSFVDKILQKSNNWLFAGII